MRIRTFCKFVDVSEVKPFRIKDTSIVIDAQNFLYNTYKQSGLPYALGCESDRFAAYLREYLSIFQKANIKCYFIFKGGHEDIEMRMKKTKWTGRNFHVNQEQDDIVVPIFSIKICKEILNEFGFKFVVSEYESKRDCTAIARKLNCPILSYDIEYCFTGLCYIPTTTLNYNERNNCIDCKYFLLNDFLTKHSLTKEKISLFIVLTDELIFPEDTFINLFKSLRIAPPLGPFKRNTKLLYWLANTNQYRDIILQFIPNDKKKAFAVAEENVMNMIEKVDADGLVLQSLLNEDDSLVMHEDPLWFAKGVALKHIAVHYINLYNHKIIQGSCAIEDNEQEDAIKLSLEIIKYAFDLLTDFQNDGFTLVRFGNADAETKLVGKTYSIPKPSYEAKECVFENGWVGLSTRGLFEHFLTETLQEVDLQQLDRLPDDARLLMIALIYFSRKKMCDTCREVYSILVSYVMLSVVFEKVDQSNLPKFPLPGKPILDPTTDKDQVQVSDCEIAAAIIKDYANTSNSDMANIFDRELLHPLVQFQHCLEQLNNLNTLCGAPFTATKYNKTYNGTLVYKVMRAMTEAGASDEQRFLENTFSPAPTVYAFLNGLIDVYDEMMM